MLHGDGPATEPGALRSRCDGAALTVPGSLRGPPALYPADRTFPQRACNPIYLIVMMLKFSNYTVVPVFAFQFMMIDKRDEYQLIGFILSFKARRMGPHTPPGPWLLSPTRTADVALAPVLCG